MDSDDQSEIAFLVPKNEGDFLCAVESTTIGHVVVTLTEILPDLKVSVAPDGDLLRTPGGTTYLDRG